MDELVKHFDLNVEADKLEEQFEPILTHIRPQWDKNSLVFETLPKEYSKGLLNTMVKCHSKDDDKDIVMIRIHNTKANAWLDRSVEIKCIKVLQPLDCAPKILASFNTGFCYQFHHGVVLNHLNLREDPIWRLIATDLAKFHSSELPGVNRETVPAELKERMEKFLSGYPEELQDPKKNEIFKKDIPHKDELTPIIEKLQKQCEELHSPLVLCHHDTRAENIVWNEEKTRIYFVDFEAMNYGYQANEISSHFARFCGLSPPDYSLAPNEEFQMEWLKYYLEKFYEFSGKKSTDVTEKDVRKLYVQVNKYYLFQLIVAGIAVPIFEAMNLIENEEVNLMEFAAISVKEYYKQKDRIMAMTLPE